MTKKIFGVMIVLLASLFLSACAIRVAGPPCLGYGCPVGTASGTAHASATTPQPAGQAVAAKNTPASQHPAISGK